MGSEALVLGAELHTTQPAPLSFLIIKMIQPHRHSGRDCRNPVHMDVLPVRNPRLLDLGNPCRDDNF
jgi:hypothetical protein